MTGKNNQTITKLALSKNKQQVHVYLDDKFTFSLALEIVLKKQLKKGQTLTSNQIDALKSESLLIILKTRALNFLSLRPKSILEMKIYLKKVIGKFGDYPNLINQTIEHLLKQDLLNEQKFASWWIEQRLRLKPKGSLALEIELKQKGVDISIIQAELKKLTKKNLSESINIVLDKAWKQIKSRHYPKIKAKQILIRRLLSKGFSWQQIKTQIDELLRKEYN